MEYISLPVLARPKSPRGIVENFVRDAIMNRPFASGERLVERELCDLLRVSRPPLREALRRLKADKLIHIVPNRGPVVVSQDPKEARDLYALRALLEGYAAHEFAALATDAQIAELGKKVEKLRSQLPVPDRHALLVAKSEFYEVLMRGSDNGLIAEVLTGLLSRINLLLATSFSKAERLVESLQEIDRIYDAIKRCSPQEGQAFATLHIQNAEKAALRILGAV